MENIEIKCTWIFPKKPVKNVIAGSQSNISQFKPNSMLQVVVTSTLLSTAPKRLNTNYKDQSCWN